MRMESLMRRPAVAVASLALLVCGSALDANAFALISNPSTTSYRPTTLTDAASAPVYLPTKTRATTSIHVAPNDLDDLPNIVFINEDDDSGNESNNDEFFDEDQDRTAAKNLLRKKSSRWARLDPKIKAKIIKQGQQRAIANKKKREPIQAKKRRLLMYVKKKQQEKKNAARITRPLKFDERTPLSALLPGMEMNGLVISLTKFGAYIDVGTECDGLLHVSQISDSVFIEHPRQVLTPGDEVTVRVRSLNADRKKLHLTMLPPEVLAAEEEDKNDETERIQLDEIMVDDELWGELRRVTDYGAYVEVGAVVDGWLHFMDHPSWDRGAHPSEFMQTGDRVRVWVADIDHEKERIKLTANRPSHLPGPRREFSY